MTDQLTDPSVVKDLGVATWGLMIVIISGIGSLSFFLRRITQAMDRMAAAQEATPALVGEMRTLIVERMERMEGKLDQSVELAREHVRIARLWERTEAPGRAVRDSPP